MTQSPLRCCTSIIRSSVLVQVSSSLSMGRARTWRIEATRHRTAFSPFSRGMCVFEWVMSHMWRSMPHIPMRRKRLKTRNVIDMTGWLRFNIWMSKCTSSGVGTESTLEKKGIWSLQDQLLPERDGTKRPRRDQAVEPRMWLRRLLNLLMMRIAFLIIISDLVPSIEGLCAQILYFRLEGAEMHPGCNQDKPNIIILEASVFLSCLQHNLLYGVLSTQNYHFYYTRADTWPVFWS